MLAQGVFVRVLLTQGQQHILKIEAHQVGNRPGHALVVEVAGWRSTVNATPP